METKLYSIVRNFLVEVKGCERVVINKISLKRSRNGL